MRKISSVDFKALLETAIRRSKFLSVILVTIIITTGCTASYFVDTPSGRKAKAYCRTFTDDGKSCVDWSETASDALVGKYTAVPYCCLHSGGRCTSPSPLAKGFNCYCDFMTPWGVNRQPGTACDN